MERWGHRSTQFVHRVVSKEVIEPARPLLWACLLHLTTATMRLVFQPENERIRDPYFQPLRERAWTKTHTRAREDACRPRYIVQTCICDARTHDDACMHAMAS